MSDTTNHDFSIKSLQKYLQSQGYIQEKLPHSLAASQNTGESCAIAYPIQGLLKYHGLADLNQRIAFFPSISMNNDSAYTITNIKMDPSFLSDTFILNGLQLSSSSTEFQRIQHQLNCIRELTGAETKVQIITRNLFTSNNQNIIGKGLGTSASGGAAIAHAMLDILYEHNSEYVDNKRLRSICARYLAGSASRSTVGGIGLWLSHKGIKTFDSFAIRLDRKENQSFIDDIGLITFAIPSSIKTDQIHKIAPKSPFYSAWYQDRNKLIQKFIKALKYADIQTIGQLTEYDTACLQAVTMTIPPPEQPMLLWQPETLAIMQFAQKLRQDGIPIYFSVDTGPSIVLITLNRFIKVFLTAWENLYQERFPNLLPIMGKIAGPSRILSPNAKEMEVLKVDMDNYAE